MEIVISNLIFIETVTVLSQQVGHGTAIAMGEYLEKDLKNPIIFIDKVLHGQSSEIFKKNKDKNISFTDCSVVAVMESEHIQKLLTFDKHFQKLRKFYDFDFFN